MSKRKGEIEKIAQAAVELESLLKPQEPTVLHFYDYGERVVDPQAPEWLLRGRTLSDAGFKASTVMSLSGITAIMPALGSFLIGPEALGSVVPWLSVPLGVVVLGLSAVYGRTYFRDQRLFNEHTAPFTGKVAWKSNRYLTALRRLKEAYGIENSILGSIEDTVSKAAGQMEEQQKQVAVLRQTTKKVWDAREHEHYTIELPVQEVELNAKKADTLEKDIAATITLIENILQEVTTLGLNQERDLADDTAPGAVSIGSIGLSDQIVELNALNAAYEELGTGVPNKYLAHEEYQAGEEQREGRASYIKKPWRRTLAR